MAKGRERERRGNKEEEKRRKRKRECEFPSSHIHNLMFNARLNFDSHRDLGCTYRDTYNEGLHALIQVRNVNRQNESDDEGSGEDGERERATRE